MEYIRIHRDATGSTNEDAFILGKKGNPAWTVCTADQQIHGRGRLDREWYSPAGSGLYVSVLIRPSISCHEVGLLSFCAANAMTKAIRESGADVRIKWPNDLIINRKKICGILSVCDFIPDNILNFAVIGAGVNIETGSYPAILSDRATCLQEEGFRLKKDKLLEKYIHYLYHEIKALEEEGCDGICTYYLNHCATIQSPVRVSGSVTFEGTAEGIDREGALLVRDGKGELRTVLSGDVSVRGLNGYI